MKELTILNTEGIIEKKERYYNLGGPMVCVVGTGLVRSIWE